MENSNSPPTAPVPVTPPTAQLENDGRVSPSPGAALPQRGQEEFAAPGPSNRPATEDLPSLRSSGVAGGHTRSKTKPSEWRKPVGLIISVVVILGAVALTLWVWSIMESHPRTDDAVARANVVGIAPRVRGQIIKINVQDNQAVAAGDVLFEIDPADYELSLEKAKAALAT